jgi:hypothetical protein
MINDLLLKLYVMGEAEYNTDAIFGKSREEFQKEIEGLSAGEKVELLVSGGKEVDETFSEGGRWSNYRTRVFRYYFKSEHVYFKVTEEVPASESQEGGDFGEPDISQVYPHKVETTIYKTTKPDGKVAK